MAKNSCTEQSVWFIQEFFFRFLSNRILHFRNAMIGKDIVAKKVKETSKFFIVVIGYFSVLQIKYQFQKRQYPFSLIPRTLKKCRKMSQLDLITSWLDSCQNEQKIVLVNELMQKVCTFMEYLKENMHQMMKQPKYFCFLKPVALFPHFFFTPWSGPMLLE